MNKERRFQIAKAVALIREAESVLETCRDDEQEYFDNMPEGFQKGKKGEAAEPDTGSGSTEAQADPAPKSVVDVVIDNLNSRIVPPADRTRLREAVDRADAPQRGRAGADEGLGRAIGGRR
jgi:hypothetical protein